MPVKRKKPKRVISSAVQLESWRSTFATGHDFFGELEPLGIVERPVTRSEAESQAARAAFVAAVRDAWNELGADFLAEWQSLQMPWALEQFGEPSCR